MPPLPPVDMVPWGFNKMSVTYFGQNTTRMHLKQHPLSCLKQPCTDWAVFSECSLTPPLLTPSPLHEMLTQDPRDAHPLPPPRDALARVLLA